MWRAVEGSHVASARRASCDQVPRFNAEYRGSNAIAWTIFAPDTRTCSVLDREPARDAFTPTPLPHPYVGRDAGGGGAKRG
jgi:hypothetical protein